MIFAYDKKVRFFALILKEDHVKNYTILSASCDYLDTSVSVFSKVHDIEAFYSSIILFLCNVTCSLCNRVCVFTP